MESGQWRAVARHPVLPLAVFINIFAWALISGNLPVYVQELGQTTKMTPSSILRWTGWIMGITPLLGVLTAPIWIHLTRGWSTRTAFMLSDVLQSFPLWLLAVARSYGSILWARAALGLGGPAQSFAFILVGHSGRPSVPLEIAAMQSAINLAIIVGPLTGALVAARWGHVTVFLLAGSLTMACALMVRLGVPASGTNTVTMPFSMQGLIAACALMAIGYMQVFFINAVLPAVLPTLGVDRGHVLAVTGWVLSLTGLVLVLSPLVTPALVSRVGESRLVKGCLVVSSTLLMVLGLAPTLDVFLVLWIAHVVTIAPIFTVVTIQVARIRNRQALGAVNVFRVFGTFVGPVVATTILAVLPLSVGFAVFGFTGLAALLVKEAPAHEKTKGEVAHEAG